MFQRETLWEQAALPFIFRRSNLYCFALALYLYAIFGHAQSEKIHGTTCLRICTRVTLHCVQGHRQIDTRQNEHFVFNVHVGWPCSRFCVSACDASTPICWSSYDVMALLHRP